MTALIDELAAALPAPVERRETHGAWVLLSGDRAYKLRKPVTLPYLDYGTPARRRRCGAAEVALNATLAPEIYLGVRALVRDAQGALQLGPWDPTPDEVDSVVVMRRFDEAATMAARLTAGRLTEAEAGAVGACIARFHLAAEPLPALDGAGRLAERIADDLRDLEAEHPEPGTVPALRRFARTALARHARVLDARARAGLIRDGHGDLRAEHVVLEADGPLVVDRVEFDPALRRIDGASDLAFLAMDLEALDGRWAAERVVAAYARAGGDPGPAGLRALLTWQRAIVRLKIALLRGDERSAARLTELADALAWRERAAPGLLVCGPPASGKSTLAQAIAERAGVRVVSSDLVRKQLHGAAPTEALAAAAYGEQASLATYRELGRRAAERIDADGAVVIDATARRPELRRALHDGLAGRGPLRAIVLEADAALLERRARDRLADPDRVSDADPAVATRLAEGFDRPRAGCNGIVRVAAIHADGPDPRERAARALDETGGATD